jgi:hypothetical protein
LEAISDAVNVVMAGMQAVKFRLLGCGYGRHAGSFLQAHIFYLWQ